MSGQLSGWRERLHANPSRMEEELAIKITRQPDKIPDTGRNTQSGQFCVARLARIPYFSRCSIASRIFTWTHQESCSHLLTRQADFIIDLHSQAFSRRFPWHPQAQQRLQPRGSDISPPQRLVTAC